MRTTTDDVRRIKAPPGLRLPAVVLLAGLLGAGAGCDAAGSEGATSSSPSPTASQSNVPVSATATATPSAAPTALDPAKDRPVEDVLVHTYRLPLGPDWMAVDERGLWVRQDRAPTLIIDPESGEVLARVKIGYEIPLCQGMGASFGAVWSCMGTDVLKIDQETMRVVDRIRLKKTYSQGHLAGGFDRVWVLLSDGTTLAGIDPQRNRIVTRFSLPARGFDLAVGPDAIWVTSQLDDKVLKVDPADGTILLEADVQNPEYVAADDQVWVTGRSNTVRLDPTTGSVLATVPVTAEPDGSIASDDHYVYVRNANDFLVQIDKATGAQVARFVSPATHGGSVAVAGGDVWVSSVDDGALYRLHLPAS